MNEQVIISFSEAFKWDTCHRQHYYGFVLGLEPLEQSEPIAVGDKGHKLLQSFYEALREGHTVAEAHDRVKIRAEAIINAGMFGDLTILPAWTLVDNYIRDNDFNVEAVLVENRFLIPASRFDDDPILENVQIGFTPDVVFKRTGDFYDVEDYKFVGRAWSKKKLNRYQQAKLYQIFLKEMGYKVSRSRLRFFNTQTGKITYNDYTTTPAEEKNIIYDFMDVVKDVVKNRMEAKMPRRTANYTACQFCSFEYPCTLQAEGKDATNTLKTQFQKRKYDYSK